MHQRDARRAGEIFAGDGLARPAPAEPKLTLPDWLSHCDQLGHGFGRK
jgi:hypothetical protein